MSKQKNRSKQRIDDATHLDVEERNEDEGEHVVPEPAGEAGEEAEVGHSNRDSERQGAQNDAEACGAKEGDAARCARRRRTVAIAPSSANETSVYTSKMLGGASQIVRKIRVKCNGT